MSDTGDTLSRFKLVNGVLVEMSDEEYAAEVAAREANAAAQEDQTNVSR